MSRDLCHQKERTSRRKKALDGSVGPMRLGEEGRAGGPDVIEPFVVTGEEAHSEGSLAC